MKRRLFTLAAAILLLLLVGTFSIIVVLGGNGIGIVAMLMFPPHGPWFVPTGFCLLGILLLAASQLARRFQAMSFILSVGLGSFGFAWLWVIVLSERRLITLISSLPFLAVLSIGSGIFRKQQHPTGCPQNP